MEHTRLKSDNNVVC